ncbi:hypothetical protein HZA33_05620 [Candidatus Pacearchaeota archaeon]|nr:hypothetical protein [Candidatus Pacearchaeota archaeon]
MKKESFIILVCIIFSMLTLIAFFSSFYLASNLITGRVVYDKNSRFILGASAIENYKTYNFEFINSSDTNREEIVINIDKISRIVKIESNGDLTILNGYIKTLGGVFSTGSCLNCRVIEKKLPDSYYITEVKLNITKKPDLIVRIFISNGITTNSAQRTASYEGSFSISNKTMILGKVSNFNLTGKLIQMNGKLYDLKYTIKSNYKIYFSDTLKEETNNSDAYIIVESV